MRSAGHKYMGRQILRARWNPFQPVSRTTDVRRSRLLPQKARWRLSPQVPGMPSAGPKGGRSVRPDGAVLSQPSKTAK